jgi:hypothetical protein
MVISPGIPILRLTFGKEGKRTPVMVPKGTTSNANEGDTYHPGKTDLYSRIRGEKRERGERSPNGGRGRQKQDDERRKRRGEERERTRQEKIVT